MVSQPVISKFFKSVKNKNDIKALTKPRDQEIVILSDDELATNSGDNDDNKNKDNTLLQHKANKNALVENEINKKLDEQNEKYGKDGNNIELQIQEINKNDTKNNNSHSKQSVLSILSQYQHVNDENQENNINKIKNNKSTDETEDENDDTPDNTPDSTPDEEVEDKLNLTKDTNTDEIDHSTKIKLPVAITNSSSKATKRKVSDKEEKIKPVKKTKKSGLTPLDEQIKELKLANLDKLLVVRVGYKYKCFASDAIIASSILQIKLVSGKLTFDETNPEDSNHKQFAYCSFPDTRLNIHLDRLIQHNLKIGIVEQIETVALKKNSANKNNNVFQRKITKVLSLATYGINVDKILKYNGNEILGDTKSIWILNLSNKKATNINTVNFSLISVNLNGGEVIFDEFEDNSSSTEQLFTRMEHLQPIEVLMKNDLTITESSAVFINFLKKNNCQLIDLMHDHSSLMEGIDVFNYPKLINVSNEIKSLIPILYNYLKEYQNENILTIAKNYKPFQSKLYMLLDGNVLSSLDIFTNDGKKGSLFWILDHTRTPFGARQLRSWIMKPLLNHAEIEKRLNAIECISNIVHHIFFEALNNLLKKSSDFLHILNRITYGSTSRREVYYFLKQLNELINHFMLHEKYLVETISKLDDDNVKESSLLKDWFLEVFEYLKDNKLPRLLSMINISGVMDKNLETQIVEFFNLNNFDQAANIIQIQKDIDNIRQELNEELINIRKILKRPHVNYKNETEYLIEIRNTQIKGVPQDWIKVNDTKLLSRFLTPECSKLVDKLQYHKDLLKNECELQYNNFLGYIKNEYSSIRSVAQNLANYDCILSLSATACSVNYVRPKFISTEKQLIKVKEGRNPVIESLDINYVPNDINMSMDDGRINIITGPNMGGKSSYMRQVALLIIMAQIGSFVPAQTMECSVFDNIFTRIGAYDDLIHGQSTFKIEMTELLYILNKCTDKSLLLLDEIGRGTGTIDGKSISYSVLKYFLEMERRPLVLFTTHFLMLTEQLKDTHNNLLKSYYMDYIEEKKPGEDWTSVSFLYKLKPGSSKDSFGLNVAKLAHIDKDIINHAYSISSDMKQDEETNEKLLRFSCQLKSIFKNSNPTKKKLDLLLGLSNELSD